VYSDSNPPAPPLLDALSVLTTIRSVRISSSNVINGSMISLKLARMFGAVCNSPSNSQTARVRSCNRKYLSIRCSVTEMYDFLD